MVCTFSFQLNSKVPLYSIVAKSSCFGSPVICIAADIFCLLLLGLICIGER